MLKDRLSPENTEVPNKNSIKVNKQLDTTNADGSVLLNLLKYMEIDENYNKKVLDDLIKQKSLNVKSMKKLIKLEKADNSQVNEPAPENNNQNI